jgi:hypothetical protein
MTSSNGTAKAVPFPGYSKFQIYWRFDTAAKRSPFDSAQGSQDSRRRLSPRELCPGSEVRGLTPDAAA